MTFACVKPAIFSNWCYGNERSRQARGILFYRHFKALSSVPLFALTALVTLAKTSLHSGSKAAGEFYLLRAKEAGELRAPNSMLNGAGITVFPLSCTRVSLIGQVSS